MAIRKQKPKLGRVVRLSDPLVHYISQYRKGGETWDTALRRLLHVELERTAPVERISMWTLPSRLVPTRAEALGLAVAEAVREARPLTERESPIKVYE